MWSGPRNISTAMMRAWDSRADCAVMDEPFYGAYLATTGLDHPMAAEIIAAHPTDWDAIAAECGGTLAAPIVYQKHMTQHMVKGAPLGWMKDVRHAFLIRPPGEVAASFKEKWSDMQAQDLGFHRQAELFDHVCQISGAVPPVIAARDVLEDPAAALRALCAALDVPWDPAMLSWTAGGRATDGIWAAHWYASVNASTGFAGPGLVKEAPAALASIVDACTVPFQTMQAHSLVI